MTFGVALVGCGAAVVVYTLFPAGKLSGSVDVLRCQLIYFLNDAFCDKKIV